MANKIPVSNTPKKANNTIKFDMGQDEEVRTIARKAHEVSKVFKETGLKFRSIIPAHTDISVRKLFKLGAKGPNFCLEIDLPSGGDEIRERFIEDIKDQFLLMPDYTMVKDSPYKLDSKTTVHRFLFRPSRM